MDHRSDDQLPVPKSKEQPQQQQQVQSTKQTKLSTVLNTRRKVGNPKGYWKDRGFFANDYVNDDDAYMGLIDYSLDPTGTVPFPLHPNPESLPLPQDLLKSLERDISIRIKSAHPQDKSTPAAPVTAQPENPKEEIHSASVKTSETEASKEELLVAKGGEKQQPKKNEVSPKANLDDSRKTPTPTTKPPSEEEEPSVVKLQSSMTAFNQKPETVGAPFENVQVQPSDEKVPHNASNMPLQKAIGDEQPETMVTTATVPFKLEPGLEALRLRDEPDKVNVVEPSMMKANDIQPETDQVEAKASSPQSAAAPEPPNKLDPHLKFYYHQEANLRSMQTCYANEISAGSSNTVQQNEPPIKSEGELIARQEVLMHKGDTFLEQMKEASSSKQAAAPATSAALPSGPMARGSQAHQSQGLSLKAKAVIAAATVAGFVIVAHMVNII